MVLAGAVCSLCCNSTPQLRKIPLIILKATHLFLMQSPTNIYTVKTSNLKVLEHKRDFAKVNISEGNHQQAAKQYQLQDIA
jgi:hypothetical protein